MTATDTGVGKTVLTGSLVAELVARGDRPIVRKPVITGLDEPASADWPHDHELLAELSGQTPEETAPLRFGMAASPHLAAEAEGRPIDAAVLASELKLLAASERPLIVEGAGGLLVPLNADYTICDLAKELGLPLLIAARPGLGTINHTLLTVNAARAAGLKVRAVVLTPWPNSPSAVEISNRETIARMGGIDVLTLTRVDRPTSAGLRTAVAALDIAALISSSR